MELPFYEDPTAIRFFLGFFAVCLFVLFMRIVEILGPIHLQRVRQRAIAEQEKKAAEQKTANNGDDHAIHP